MANESIPVYVHGLRNLAGEFEGGKVELEIGSMSGPSYAGKQDTVLLVVVGQDEVSKQPIDIEIAIPFSHIRDLIERLQRASQIG